MAEHAKVAARGREKRLEVDKGQVKKRLIWIFLKSSKQGSLGTNQLWIDCFSRFLPIQRKPIRMDDEHQDLIIPAGCTRLLFTCHRRQSLDKDAHDGRG